MEQQFSGGQPKPTVIVDAAIHIPVEILANLVYLANRCAEDADQVRLLMESAEEQLAAIAVILRKAI